MSAASFCVAVVLIGWFCLFISTHYEHRKPILEKVALILCTGGIIGYTILLAWKVYG